VIHDPDTLGEEISLARFGGYQIDTRAAWFSSPSLTLQNLNTIRAGPLLRDNAHVVLC
jgi:hypothetical protein